MWVKVGVGIDGIDGIGCFSIVFRLFFDCFFGLRMGLIFQEEWPVGTTNKFQRANSKMVGVHGGGGVK